MGEPTPVSSFKVYTCERAALFHLVCVCDWSQWFVVLGEDEEVALPLLQSCTASYLTRNGVTIGVCLFCSNLSDLFGESPTFIVLIGGGGLHTSQKMYLYLYFPPTLVHFVKFVSSLDLI